MTFKTSMRRSGTLARLAIYCVFAQSAFGAGSLINATLEPTEITVGESTELAISTSGNGSEPITLPQVAGLDFRIIGQSHRVEIVRGATLVTTALIVRVTPRTAGTYTIPAFSPKTQPLVLRVDPDTGGGGARFGKLTGSAPPAKEHLEGVHLSPDGSAYVRMLLPKRDIYVGESVPVDIEVGMRDGFVKSLNGLPVLNGGDFTLNNLSHQPQRLQRQLDGKPFTVLSWHTVLAAVKPGKYSLSVETPLTVKIATRPERESKLEDALGDPFFQNVFGATVPKDITVSSPPAEMTVLSLPQEGQPPGFSGAVGSFKISGETSAPTAAAGDPLTLRMHITGSGNFDRVDSSMLSNLPTWKTYPPKSSFKASDSGNLQGEKIFEQPLIATQPGVLVLPPLTFSYFDPALKRYETARAAPLTVTVTASSADQSLDAGSLAASVGAPGAAPPAPAVRGLHADHAVSSGMHASLMPLYLRPGFLALPSALSLVFAGGWLSLRRRPSDVPAVRKGRRLSKNTRRHLKDLDAAALAGNAPQFFNAARSALLSGGAAAATEGAAIREIFDLADAANYSGDPPGATDFARFTHIVRERLLHEPAP